MKTMEAAACLLFAVAVLSDPEPEVKTRKIIENRLFSKEFLVYSTNHTVLNINVPIDATRLYDVSNDDDGERETLSVFFNLVDIHSNGTIERLGQYVLKDGKAHEVLKFGTDSASDFTTDTNVYLGAKDGLYIYNHETMSAAKYGPITDSIIQLRKAHAADLLYVLTENHMLYKVTENGTIKTVEPNVTCAQEFAIDTSHNLYYYCSDKVLHMRTVDGTITKISGLPETIISAKLVDPPFVLNDTVVFVADGDMFKIFANATSQASDFKLQATPSSRNMNTGILLFFAVDGKIYRFDILEPNVQALFGQPNESLNEL